MIERAPRTNRMTSGVTGRNPSARRLVSERNEPLPRAARPCRAGHRLLRRTRRTGILRRPDRRLVVVRRRPGRHALLAAHADRSRQRRSARGGLDLPHRRAHRRSFLRVRGHADPGRRAAGVLHAVEPRDRPRSRDRRRAVALRSRARSVDLLRQPVRLPRASRPGPIPRPPPAQRAAIACSWAPTTVD